MLSTIRTGGPFVLAVDEQGLTLTGSTAARWNFSDGLEAEDAGGMIYFWPRSGAPAVLPARAFPSAEAVSEFVALARAGITKARTGRTG